MNKAYNDYMREYMKKYRQTDKGKEITKKANKKYWERISKCEDTLIKKS